MQENFYQESRSAGQILIPFINVLARLFVLPRKIETWIIFSREGSRLSKGLKPKIRLRVVPWKIFDFLNSFRKYTAKKDFDEKPYWCSDSIEHERNQQKPVNHNSQQNPLFQTPKILWFRDFEISKFTLELGKSTVKMPIS